MEKDPLQLGSVTFTNRLFTGTGKFASNALIPGMLKASGSEMITVALRRIDITARSENILDYIPKGVTLLPNTSGARNAEQAIRIARIAREAGCGDFIKIEVITDMKYLMPDNIETLKATEILAREGFIVLPRRPKPWKWAPMRCSSIRQSPRPVIRKPWEARLIWRSRPAGLPTWPNLPNHLPEPGHHLR